MKGGEDRYCRADGGSRSSILLEARANMGKQLWDRPTVRTLLDRTVANGSAAGRASGISEKSHQSKLSKDEANDQQERFRAAKLTDMQCAFPNMHTTDSLMGERNSYTGNRPCTKSDRCSSTAGGDRGNLRVMVRCHKPLTGEAIPWATHATTRRAGKGN